MVTLHTKNSQTFVSTPSWLTNIATSFPPAEVEVLRTACELAEPIYQGHVEVTGTPLMQHALGTASILIGMNMDYETVSAAILYAVPDHLDDSAEKIDQACGANVKMLVEGMSRMGRISLLGEVGTQDKNAAAQQIESLRKMLLAMVDDIRVVLIKLAERTQTLRNLSGASAEQQKLIAQQTRSLFAPLANRLGVWQLKWELEDLSVRYLEPELYKKIAKLLDERRVDRERYITEVVAKLKQSLHQAGISAEVTGRAKHIYSIINKMKRKQLDFSELYDVRAVRILVDDVQSCYTALGIVQSLWTPISSEFDDYIAHPKSNNYRSLHTAVIGSQGLASEVQI
ncbi:MAG: bifunctional (p)ppGpp synthetase/guanosine-3',5'-bis(diphosphate) 3'-pyrophosphohydrolase, partial [Gallionella sp.]|nr:bifunctional (p)ppGpp synthetase/guanosine-3',5'-bis(diphosphate) 3'-pyrophosphohydrolase [Gallionella sp.]